MRPTNTTRPQRTNCQPLSMFVRCIIRKQDSMIMVPDRTRIVYVTLIAIYIYLPFTDAPLIFSLFLKLSTLIIKF